MPSQSTPIRALRVGVLLRGNLVEERLFRDADRLPITIGQSLRCRLSIPADGLPMEHVLFAVDQGRFVLRPPAKATGRIAQGDAKLELGDGAPVAIQRGARGKLVLGDATILFQELAAPPVQPLPQLPASIRGTLLDRVDRRLAIIVGASLMAHIGIGSWAWFTADPERDTTVFEDTQATVIQQTFSIYEEEPVLPPPAPVKTDGDGGQGVAKPAKPTVQTPRPVVPNPTVNPDRPPTRPEQLTTTEEAQRLAEMLTTDQETSKGVGDMNRRRPDADLDRMAKDVIANGQTPVLGNKDRVSRTDQTEVPGKRKGTLVDGPKQLDQTQKQPELVTERLPPVRPLPPPPGGGDVLAKIQGAYMGSIQRCYMKGLADQPTLSGTVALVLTVNERGRVDNPSASGVSAGVSGCIQGLMGGWMFNIKKDKDGDPVEATYKISLAMNPH